MSTQHLRDSLRTTTGGFERLRAVSPTGSQAVGVDRANAIVRGFVVAQLGFIKPYGRGEFDRAAIEEIVRLGNAATRGLRSNWTHGNLCEDQLGTHLGRAFRFRVATARDEDGRQVDAARADLHIDRTALKTPPRGGRPYGEYVMDLAESDPGAISSSLVIDVDKVFRLKPDGTRQTDSKGEPLPPLWKPKKLLGSDIVARGAAVDDLLSGDPLDSFDDLRDGFVWQAESILSRLLSEGRLGTLSRREIKQRLNSWLDRALDEHLGPDEPADDMVMRRIKLRQHDRDTLLIRQQMGLPE